MDLPNFGGVKIMKNANFFQKKKKKKKIKLNIKTQSSQQNGINDARQTNKQINCNACVRKISTKLRKTQNEEVKYKRDT